MIPVRTFEGKEVAVLGLGRSGIATARALMAGGATFNLFYSLLAGVLVTATLYTAALLSTTVIKNWGLWIDWWKARWADLSRFIRWIKE